MKVEYNKGNASSSFKTGNAVQRKSSARGGYVLEDNRPHPLQRKVQSHDPVVQRAIISQLFDDDNLSPEDTTKMNQVTTYMNQSLSGIKSKIKTLFINVVNMPGKNPADTRLNDPGTAIVVRLASWFVRTSSVGDICGMLSHEIGVHTLASNQMTKQEKEEESEYQKEPFDVSVGLHTHTITPWDNGQSSRQRDHINVGRDKGNNIKPLRHSQSKRKKVNGKKQKRSTSDVNSVNARAIQYAQTTLRLGDAINSDATISDKEKDQRLHDLLNSFLFDYARIIATNDQGIRSFDKAPLVAQVFNWYKNVIIARYGEKHPWLNRKSMQPTASTWGLRAYLLGKLAMGVGSQLKPGGKTGAVIDSIGSGISTVGGWGSSLLGAIGSGISSVTPEIVKKGAGKLGSGVVSTLRGIDQVYGEAENLVVPHLVSGGLWAKDRMMDLLEIMDTG